MKTLFLNYELSIIDEIAYVLFTGLEGKDTKQTFVVSSFTPQTDNDKLGETTIDYSKRIEKFSGLSDWRLHLFILTAITILIYTWLS